MKDYKKIPEGVVDIINNTEKSDIGFANICTYIGENCPELKESEDERIRESLLEYLHTLPNHYAHSGVCAPEWIAWLEKQGKTFTKKDIDDAYLKGVCDAKQELEKQGEQNLIMAKSPQLGEQKPTEWNEEDIMRIDNIIAIIENRGYPDYVEYLEKLKHRIPWKPSDEQMEALWNVYQGGEEQAELATLYTDLKKLRIE